MSQAPDPERSCRAYAPDVEAFWVERAKHAAGTASFEGALSRVIPVAAAVSDRFTTERPEEFRDYGDAETLLAYGIFFFPQSWCRVRFALAEAADVRGWAVPADRPVRILDLGAGTGAAGLSAARWCIARGAPSVCLDAVDHSPAALRVLAELARSTNSPRGEVRVATRAGDLSDPWAATFPGLYDLVLVSFAVNEAFAGADDATVVTWLASLADRLAPEGLIVVVEPALRETSLRLRRLAADALDRSGGALHAVGPQLASGPWRPREDGRFWPHEVRRWRLPPSVAFVNRKLKRSLAELAFSYATFGRREPEPFSPEARLFRLTSPVAEAKGRLVWTGLGADGLERGYEGLTRGLAAADAARIETFERGDVLEADAVAPVGGAGGVRVATLAALRSRFHPD